MALLRAVQHSIAFAVLALCTARAQEPIPEYVAYESEALGLAVRLPESLAAVPMRSESAVTRKWTGQIGPCEVDVLLLLLEREPYGIEEPEDVNELWEADVRRPEKSAGKRIAFREQECVVGSFGWTGHAAYLRGSIQSGRGQVAAVFLFSGLQQKQSWTLRVDTNVEPEVADADAIRDLLVGAVTVLEPAFDPATSKEDVATARDPRWGKDEIRKLWLGIAPESTKKKLEPPVRSQHYIVQADGTGGSAFLKKLEEHYATVRKILTFPEISTRRLLPVYLFRTKDEYTETYMKVFGATREIAEEQSGHTQGIYYITYFEDLDDPDHLYQATRQILRARLRLDRCAWFTEGFAKYVATKPTERSIAAHRVKLGEHLPLAELMLVPSLMQKTERERITGVDAPDRRVLQAALLIEFLRDSKWSRGRFPAFAHAVGVIPNGDQKGLEDALRAVFETDFIGLENAWIDYCKKR